jgi:plasmid stability protein
MGRGRAPKGEYAGKTEVMSFRLTPDTKAALRRAAATSGRSLSQEAEHRLRRGLDEEETISKLWGDVKTSAMLRLAAQVVQSLGTMRDTKVHWTADAKVFDSGIEAIAGTCGNSKVIPPAASRRHFGWLSGDRCARLKNRRGGSSD